MGELRFLTLFALCCVLSSAGAKAESLSLSEEVTQIKAELQSQRDISEDLQSQLMELNEQLADSTKRFSLGDFGEIEAIGRVNLDVTVFGNDEKDNSNNINFRRARLGFQGSLGEDMKFKSEVDFSDNDVSLTDVTLTYGGFSFVDLKVGHFRYSFGLEQNTSANHIQFIERSAPVNVFTGDRELGFALSSGGESWSLISGVFGQSAGNTSPEDDEDLSFYLRGSANVLSHSENVVHIAASVGHRRPNGDVRFSARPAGDSDRIVDTGSFDMVDHVNVYAAELAAVFGPVSLQTEYYAAEISGEVGGPDADFDGVYAQVGLFLTDDSRPYRGSVGNFTRVKPNTPIGSGCGAWEVLARYERVDLNDASAGISGGKLDNITGGINWYLQDNLRLMLNITQVNVDNNAPAPNDDPLVYNFRTQWDF